MRLQLVKDTTQTKNNKLSLKSEQLYGFFTAVIPLLGFVLFAVLPIIISSIYSFTTYNRQEGGSPYNLLNQLYIGAENFKEVLTDPLFYKAVGNTFINCLVTPFSMLVGLIIALLVSNTKLLGRNVFKALFFIPYVCSIVASCLIWVCLVEKGGPLYNFFEEHNWEWALNLMDLNEPAFARPFMIFLGVWSGSGFSVIMYTAALTNVDTSIIEASKMDGANKWQTFKSVTFPAIMPVTFFLFITGIIGNLQDFTRFSLVGDYTRADGAYVTMAYYLYHYMDPSTLRLGLACAASWILAVIILVVTTIQFVTNRKQGDTTK